MYRALQERECGLLRTSIMARQIRQERISNIELSGTKTVTPCHQAPISALDLDIVESRYLLSGSVNCTISVYDVNEGLSSNKVKDSIKPITTVGKEIGHSYAISALQWYPLDTGMFFSGSMDETVKVWDTNSMQPVSNFKFSGKVYSIGMSSTASQHALLAVGGQDATVRLCDLGSGAFTHSLSGHRDAVWSVQWAPHDPFLLATGSCDKTIRFWDIRRSGCVQSLDQHRSVQDLKCKPRQQTFGIMASSSSSSSSSSSLTSTTTSTTTVAKNGVRKAPSRDENNKKNTINNPKKRKLTGNVDLTPERFRMEPSNDKGSNDRINMNRGVSIARPRPTITFSHATAHDSAVTAMKFTPNGRYLLSTARDAMRCWETDSGANCLVNYHTARNTHRKASQIAVDPTGRYVYHPNESNIGVYDILSGQEVKNLKGHYDNVNCVVFNLDSEEFYSAGDDRLILVWQPLPNPSVEDVSKPFGRVPVVPNGRRTEGRWRAPALPPTGQLAGQATGQARAVPIVVDEDRWSDDD